MMTGFAFRLQNVLDYRMSLVDRARLDLTALQALLDDAEATLAVLQQIERDALAELTATQTSALLDVGEITRLLQYGEAVAQDRKSTRLNSSHLVISYAVFCLK